MTTTREIGRRAEQIAQNHLLNLGYKILDSNWQFGHLELDIVAREKDQLVIVEVKSRSGVPFDHPSDAINDNKIRRVIEATEAYIIRNELELETRFDLITVVFVKDEFELEHFIDAFYPTL